MKFLRKVKPIEVKRCFVISNYVSHRKYLTGKKKSNTKKEYLQLLRKAEKIILELPERMLDMMIKGEWKKRWKLYNKLEWYVGTFNINEVGVWKKAGGLPLNWTRNSLEETAKIVEKALENNSKTLKHRSKVAIPGILKNSLPLIQKEKYLLPIVLPGGSMGRKGLKKMKGDIDDGCMRSIALAVSGKKIINAYIGKKKK